MLDLSPTSVLAFAFGFLTLLFAIRRGRILIRSASLKPPPGPKADWFVGHTFQVPKTKAWRYFEKLGEDHGPIVKLTLAGDDIVVLNDPQDAEEILGRRSRNYSSRRPLVYAGKYLSRNKRLLLLPYGPQLKKQRQAFHQMLQPRAVGAYESMQVTQSIKLLYDMLVAPQEAFLNAKRFSASLVFNLCYGRRLSPDGSDLKEILQIMDGLVEDCYPGTHLVDTFPILDSWFVPDWIARWRSEASRKHEREITFYLRHLNEVKSRMDSGEAQLECFAARLWEQQEKLGLDHESMAYVAGSAFEAGSGPTSGTLLLFVIAMALHPQALSRAQEEIDSVVSMKDGPPTFDHMKKLPYCVALCKEVLRWIPAAPGGFPHYSDQDDTYNGYNIQAGTMVIPNIWAMQHNPAIFSDPMTFMPERFLRENESACEEPDVLTKGHWGFGFGRRICPGQYMAANTVWIGMAQMMWAFDIRQALDAQGNPIAIDTEALTSGINIEPLPFEASITPRSEKHAERIRQLWSENISQDPFSAII